MPKNIDAHECLTCGRIYKDEADATKCEGYGITPGMSALTRTGDEPVVIGDTLLIVYGFGGRNLSIGFVASEEQEGHRTQPVIRLESGEVYEQKGPDIFIKLNSIRNWKMP
jgi:hypothetical protein